MRGSGEKRSVHVRRDKSTGTSSDSAIDVPAAGVSDVHYVAVDRDGESNAKAPRGVRDEVHPVGEDGRGA